MALGVFTGYRQSRGSVVAWGHRYDLARGKKRLMTGLKKYGRTPRQLEPRTFNARPMAAVLVALGTAPRLATGSRRPRVRLIPGFPVVDATVQSRARTARRVAVIMATPRARHFLGPPAVSPRLSDGEQLPACFAIAVTAPADGHPKVRSAATPNGGGVRPTRLKTNALRRAFPNQPRSEIKVSPARDIDGSAVQPVSGGDAGFADPPDAVPRSMTLVDLLAEQNPGGSQFGAPNQAVSPRAFRSKPEPCRWPADFPPGSRSTRSTS